MNCNTNVAQREALPLHAVADSCVGLHDIAPVTGASGERTAPPGAQRSRSGADRGLPLGLSMSHISPDAFGTPFKGYWKDSVRLNNRKWSARRLKAHGQRVEDQRADESSISWYQGSEFIKIKSLARNSINGGGARGNVKAFTREARKRMLDFLRSLNRQTCGLPLFVTLTYPGVYPDDPAQWKKHLDNFRKAIRRQYPDAWGPWKLEPQRRGAPHFHLLVFGVKHIDKTWLSNTWYRIVGSGDERHRRAGTQVARIASWRGVVSYAAKYMGKVLDWLPEAWQSGVGRWWGMFNRKAAEPHRERHQLRVNLWAMHRMRRVLRKRLAKGLKHNKGGRRFLQWIKGMRQGQGMTFHLPAVLVESLLPWAMFEAQHTINLNLTKAT